jgi:lipopolysaccharide transport system ATP-binding protein
MSDIVIQAENVGKKYLIGHHAAKDNYATLRDVVVRGAKKMWQKAQDLASGKPIVMGDQMEEVWALKDVSFDIRRGEAVGIIGRNGAGKSTLLKILSRITEPTTGRVTIKGRIASLLEVGTGFHPELTGRENIFLNGTILGMRRAEIRRKFDEIVAFSEVERYLDTPVKRYSSGMYVRLAFAVAAHLEPEILIVDEVLAVGDAQFQKKCLGKMSDVASEGRTVLFVSHNMAAVSALCERALLISEGSVICGGGTDGVIQQYGNLFQEKAAKTPLYERDDRMGNGSVRAIAIRFGTTENPECGFWVTGKDAVARLDYRSDGDGECHFTDLAVGVRRVDQTPLILLKTGFVDQDVFSFRGSSFSVCRIERLPLEAGRYSVNVEITCKGTRADRIEQAALVDVLEGDYYGTGRGGRFGGVLCEFSWSHASSTGDRMGV